MPDDFEQLRDLLQPEYCHGPIPEQSIAQAEHKLGLAFPPLYREFIKNYGAASHVLSIDIFGLLSNNITPNDYPHYQDVVERTLELRTDRIYGYPMPDSFVFVAGDATGMGADFFLDTAACGPDGEPPVLIQGAGIPRQVFAPNFLELFLKMRREHEPYASLDYGPVVAAAAADVETDDDTDDEEPPPISVTWYKMTPGPFPSEASELAQYVGLVPESGKLFVYAEGTKLDIEQQMEAFETSDGFFADPIETSPFQHPYISVDYLLRNHPDGAFVAALELLKSQFRDHLSS